MIGTQCPHCRHYRGALRCAAFPGGIPEVILRGEIDHSRRVAGDGGIRFERGRPELDDSLTVPETLPRGVPPPGGPVPQPR